MDNCYINGNETITGILLGPYSTIDRDQDDKPKGYRFVLGERLMIKM